MTLARISLRQSISAALFLSVAFLATGCNCKGQSVGTSYGDLGVVWKDATTGVELVYRDAVYDFGT